MTAFRGLGFVFMIVCKGVLSVTYVSVTARRYWQPVILAPLACLPLQVGAGLAGEHTEGGA